MKRFDSQIGMTAGRRRTGIVFLALLLNTLNGCADIPQDELQTIPFGIGGRNMEVANLALVHPLSLSAVSAVAAVSSVQRIANATANRSNQGSPATTESVASQANAQSVPRSQSGSTSAAQFTPNAAARNTPPLTSAASAQKSSSSPVTVGAARGHAAVSEVQGIYTAHSPGPPPESVSASSPALAMGTLEMMVDIFA